MMDKKKLDRWADKLLDTGKRNNLINFRDTKASSAEVLYPDCETFFSKCLSGHVFEVFDPRIPDEEEDNEITNRNQEKILTKSEYRNIYASRIKNSRYILAHAQTPNPIKAVKNIAKKAKELQDESGINVAYLAFGFIKWNEREGSEVFYRAPLLLIHINIITGTVIDPIRIEVGDDDVVVNPTFNYLLQANYGLSLPAYDDGDSLATYYEKVTTIIKKMGWETINECKIGTFSFLKINMYEDLKNNTDKILENENVKALLGESSSTSFGLSGENHIVQNPIIDLHTVVDADSSQIEAVEMAKSGKSFVLQGPPGTGKSQTITNIIAECLHDGKKVLFVSEKQAALNVVFDKLKKAGLADFCLELHSHKANKKAVIAELNRTLEVPKSKVSSTAKEEIRQKKSAQSKLDRYAEELHKKRNGIEKSLYQLFEAYSAEREYPDIQVELKNIQEKGKEYLEQCVKMLEQYSEYVPSIGQNYRSNPWYGFNNVHIGYEQRNQLKQDFLKLIEGFRELQIKTNELKHKYESPQLNYIETVKWQKILAFLAKSDVVTPTMLSQDSLEKMVPALIQLKDLSEIIVQERNNILLDFKEDVLSELNGKEIYTELTEQFNGVFARILNKDYKNIVTKVQMLSKDGKKFKYQQIVDFSKNLMSLQELINTFDNIAIPLQDQIGPCYKGPDTNWDHVMDSIEVLRNFFDQETINYGLLSSMDRELFINNQDMFWSDAIELEERAKAIAEAKERVQNCFDTEILNLDKQGYDYCIKKVLKCSEDFEKLGNWIGFMTLLDHMNKMELQPYIDLIINKQIEADEVVGTYKKAFYKQWIEYIIFSVRELSSFSRIKQDQAVRNFVEQDGIQYEISKAQIKSELSQKRPNLDMIAGGSAVAILRREGQKKRKQMPIRKLLLVTGDLVQILKPCFLMSPLSVSTFLDSEKISFDTVVFDEASQIFPQDAIGAIYRGKQLIVVGDSKQMPPSNFFNASADIDDDDEEVGDINDFESILDICSSVFNTERLVWHYRSHYEQLIAFSNINFYNNNLVTFPSSSTDHKGIGVDYYHVDGVFDRKSKTNKAEALFIIDLIYKNIETHPDRSLGVVAFSVSQQNLIERLLSKKREEDPSYEWFFKADNPEPFFIKNLETVQGDERDTIIFSVAYAKDTQGRFIHNFGPLNREGGERRLNVAVTRAKDNVQLVASISYTDINLNRSGSEGVRLLRAYLDYAQNGEIALERAITVTSDDHFDSYFEQEICDFLRDQGFTVDTQVGCSGYRIDLGLRKPGSSNYLLAIECDGATYHSSKNARDRDSLRQRVLENMGWQFYRIWSTDWYRNKMVEKERLLRAVKDAIENSKKPSSTNSKIDSGQTGPIDMEQKRFIIEKKEATYNFPKYIQADAMTIMILNMDDFQNGIRKILEKEAPLAEEYLLKRIIKLFGREKISKTVIRDFNSKMYLCERRGIIRRNGFLYLKEENKYKLRVPGVKRKIGMISTEEIAAGLYELIKQNITVSKDNLYKTMTNLLGFSRTGDTIVNKYDDALSELIKDNLIKIENNQVSLK